MEFLLSRFRNFVVLMLMIFAQLLLLAYQVKSSQDVRLIRVWAVTAVTPIAKVLEFVRRNTIGLVEDYFVLINVREENRKLKADLGTAKMENHFLRTELETADRAIALKAFQARTPSRTVPARVIGTGTGANSRVVYVDQGTAAGIERGMAVVTPDGIVGKVLDAYPTASQVLLVTDPGFAAGVMSQKNRVHGTMKGLGQSKCAIDHVQNEEKVEPGEMFYTSGDDRIFPKGMPAGRVTVARPGKNFKEIYIVPAGLQNGAEEVLIVVQAVHQDIPEHSELSSGDIHLTEPPSSAPEASTTSALHTEADRMRDRYKEVGDAQGHQFGEGGPGAKPPNFNLQVRPAGAPPAPTPNATGTAAGAAVAAGSTSSGSTPVTPSKPKPTLGPDGQPLPATTTPAAAKPKPEVRLGPDGQPLSATTTPAAAKPKPTVRLGPDGQPLPPVTTSKPKPDVVSDDQPATAPPKRVTTNDTTINIVTPPPKTAIVPRTTDPGPTPAGSPRTTGPTAQTPAQTKPVVPKQVAPPPPKPKPERTETVPNP